MNVQLTVQKIESVIRIQILAEVVNTHGKIGYESLSRSETRFSRKQSRRKKTSQFKPVKKIKGKHYALPPPNNVNTVHRKL